VIAEVTVKVVKSAANLAVGTLLYYDIEDQAADIDKAVKMDKAEGLIAGNNLVELPMHSFGCLHSIGFLKEISKKNDLAEFSNLIHSEFNADAVVFWKEQDKDSIDISLGRQTSTKRSVVYWYPKPQKEAQLEYSHPWTDGVIPKKHYLEFVAETRKLVKKYNMEECLIRQSFWHDKMTLSLMGVYLIKNMGNNFPLSLDLHKGEEYSMCVNLLTNVPIKKIKNSLSLSKDVANLFYDFGGKFYLYGYHQLTKKQIQQHFGQKTINQWNGLKDKLDPKHLLNIGVIEHLD